MAPTRKGRDEIIMKEERVLNTFDTNTDVPASSGLSAKWSAQRYVDCIKIEIINEDSSGMELEFDLLHVDPPIANALRRILLAEVYLYQNTSIIQDEVLCHRLGLLPLCMDPRPFKFPTKRFEAINIDGTDCPDGEPNGDPERNVVFKLNVKCTRIPPPRDVADATAQYEHSSVYSRDFHWVPFGDQQSSLLPTPTMVHDDILVAKLRPGQEIEASCHCVKGVGKDHTKFSPVATASYRLLPTIRLTRDVVGEQAVRLKESFTRGTIGLKEDDQGEQHAVVLDPRRDLCSRNVLRHKDLTDAVEMGRVRDHFIFSVESTGALRSSDLVTEACKVMEAKIESLLRGIGGALPTG